MENEMKMTVGDLMLIRDDLHTLFGKEMPIETSWKISKFISRLENEYNDFENNRLKLLKKFIPEGAKKIPEDEVDGFRTELQKLLDIDIEVDLIPISITDLKGVTISPMALSKMSFLFNDQEPIADSGNLDG